MFATLKAVGSTAATSIGLAPGGCSPASGLHIVRVGASVSDAAFLAGLYNSSIYQAIVDSLPPGNVRGGDLLAIGTPELPEVCRHQIARCALGLAELVVELVSDDGDRFPLLGARLGQDVSLADPGLEAWWPEPGPSTRWGRLEDVAWASLERLGHTGRRVGEARLQASLLGRFVEVYAAGGSNAAVRIVIDRGAPEEAPETLACLLCAARVRKMSCGEVGELFVPVDPDELIAIHRHNRARALGRSAAGS